MIEWIDVEKKLPPCGEIVLLLVKGYFQLGNDPLSQRMITRIMEGSFNSRIGWKILSPEACLVIGWAPRPKDLEIEINCSN